MVMFTGQDVNTGGVLSLTVNTTVSLAVLP
jgi:hypothetical protein